MTGDQTPRRNRYYLGESYGGSATHGRDTDTIEWEWVHVGRAFALSHPKGKVRGGLWLIAAFVGVQGAVSVYAVVTVSAPLGATVALIDGITLIALAKRWRIAWPLVWMCLIASFPISVPFMFYWADGVRPNLIYRHRFERLIRRGEAGVL